MYYYQIKTDMNSTNILFKSKKFDTIDEIKNRIESLLGLVYKGYDGFLSEDNYDGISGYLPSSIYKNYIEIRKDL